MSADAPAGPGRLERSEMAGRDPDGSAGEAGGRAPRGIERSEPGGGDPGGIDATPELPPDPPPEPPGDGASPEVPKP